MAIEIYRLSNQKQDKLLLQLPEEQFTKLDGVFAKFQKSTGVFVDPYGTTRIYYDHLKLLYNLLLDHKHLINSNQQLLSFTQTLKTLIDEEDGIIVEGE